jgi:hypothetical protein
MPATPRIVNQPCLKVNRPMATQQFTVEDDRYRDAPPVHSTNWLKGCLLGCLGVVVVLLVLGTVAAIWISRNWKSWAASSMSVAVKQGIDQTDLPAEEKAQINDEINRAADMFADGRLSGEQAARLIQKAMNSPLMTVFVASAAEKKYIDGSGLSEEEKAEAKITLQRFLRGSFDEDIDRSSIDAALRHVSDKQPNGQPQFRDKVSDAELREFLAEAKKAADEANVPEQPQAVDPSDEVKRIIDEAMTEPVGAPPMFEPAPPMEIPPAIEVQPEAEAPPEPKAEN